MTFKQFIDHYEQVCIDKNKSEFVVKYVTMELSNLEPHIFYTRMNDDIDEPLRHRIQEALNQYIDLHIPIDYILGYRYFFGYKFYVNEHVLIPRNETEELVEHVLMNMDDMSPPLKLLDLGTGSGCIGITIKKEYSDVEVTLADISEDALKVAQQNAHQLNVDVSIVTSNWFSNIKGKYHVIVCNPPYIPEEEAVGDTVDKEPSLALFGGKSGLHHYETVLSQAQKFLHDGGFIAFEHGYDQKQALHQLIHTYMKYATIETMQDLQGKDRMTIVYPSRDMYLKEV